MCSDLANPLFNRVLMSEGEEQSFGCVAPKIFAQNTQHRKRFKMAKEASLADISKKELAEQYASLKRRMDKSRKDARSEGETLIRDVITVGSGAGVGYLMGSRAASVGGAAASEEELAEAQQIAGVDMDLVIGGGLAAVGLMKMGGKMSDTVRAAGIGALTSWASRLAHEKGLEAED